MISIREKYTLGYDQNSKACNTDFPSNYLRDIKEYIGKTELLLVGCQPQVLARLHEMKISFVLIYPERGLKAQYVQRFQQRDSGQSFIDLLAREWDSFLDFLESQEGCRKIVLGDGQYLSDVADVF